MILYSKPVQAASKRAYFTPNSITKDDYVTPIWEQHKIWGSKTSAGRHGCGVACVTMALNLSGVVSYPNDVLTQMGRSIKHCKPVLAKNAVACFRKNGLTAFPYNSKAYSKKKCIKIMKKALNEGNIVMVYVKGKPFSSGIHWVLLTGYSKKGKVVVANSSYGCMKVCKKTKRQYHLVTWKQISAKLYRGKKKYSSFVVINPSTNDSSIYVQESK